MTQPTGQGIEPVSIVLPGVYPDALMLVGIDTSLKPLYTINEVSKNFFRFTRYWVRWCEEKGLFDTGATDPQTGRPVRIYGRTAAGARVFTLANVEALVHALASRSAIDGEVAARALAVVYDVARVHGYLPDVVGVERAARVERQALHAELDAVLDGHERVRVDRVRPVLDRLQALERESQR